MTGPQQSHDGYDSSNNQGHYDDQSPDYRDDYPPTNTGGSGKFSFAAIVVMLVFAVVATIIMLFTDSETWTKIAVLCALWAAIVGCIAVARLRKQVDNQQRDTDNLERLHQAELERELATHREQELILEQNYYDSLQEQEQNTLADIRAELTVLRENLSAMMGTDLDTERTALKAEAQRILELERDSKDSSSTTEARTSGSTSRTSSVPASHAPSGKRGQNRGGAGQTQGAGKASGAGNTAAAQPGRTNQSSSRSRAADSTSTQQDDNSLRTGSFNAVKWTAQPSRRSGSGYSADQTTVLPSVEYCVPVGQPGFPRGRRGETAMTSTKPTYLVATALIVGLGAFMLIWRFYGSIPGFNLTLPVILIVLAVICTIAGFIIRKRIADNEVGQDRSQIHPLTIARCFVMGTSTAWFGSICAGSYAGIAVYLWINYSRLIAAREDTPAVVVGLIAAILVAASGLWLERCCGAPPPNDEDTRSSNVVWSS